MDSVWREGGGPGQVLRSWTNVIYLPIYYIGKTKFIVLLQNVLQGRGGGPGSGGAGIESCVHVFFALMFLFTEKKADYR